MSDFGNNTIHGKNPTSVAGQPREVENARRTTASNADHAAGPGKDAPHGNEGEVVTLTFAPDRLQSIEEAVRNTPAVDRTRVRQLKTLVESGRFSIDAERTAEKLLQTEQLLD